MEHQKLLKAQTLNELDVSWQSMPETDFDQLVWDSDHTLEEIKTKYAELLAEYDANEYARNRASAYDSIGDQLDMIYKDNLNGTTTHKASVEAVKAQFPKP
tara:strand:- start:192 stop:494 length:303 start_codon:yes stop_codon:yes gene_type:complete